MLVVDASVAVKFVTQEPGSDEAYEILVGADPLVAPDWLLVEVASAMWDKVRRSVLLQIHAERNLASTPDLFARLFPTADLLSEAFNLSFQLGHAVYNCLYLALAMRERAALITADRDFFRSIRRSGRYDGARLLEWRSPA